MGRDLTKIEMDDRPEPARRQAPAPKPKADPSEANIFTADKGIQPPMDDEGPTLDRKPVRKAKGGSVGSASKRADGIAQRGKTRGKMI